MSKQPIVSIIDYGMGNLFSVKQACEYAGFRPVVTHSAKDIMKADGAILPGVGAFGDAISNLNRLGLKDVIRDFIRSGKPFMGICLGMQLLFTASEEFGRYDGLDLISGKVLKFPSVDNNGVRAKVPQVGWNRISTRKSGPHWDNSPLREIGEGSFMYFVHSYYCMPADDNVALSISEYSGIEYCSSILQGNVYASQFHPEKSAEDGIKIYKNWLNNS